jgi:hypothetical protein
MQLAGNSFFSAWWAKKRLLDVTVNVREPILRTFGAAPKMNCLCLKLSCSVLGSPQLGRELVREIHGPLAVLLCHIGSLLQQGNDAMTGIIRQHSRIRVPLLRDECNNRS